MNRSRIAVAVVAALLPFTAAAQSKKAADAPAALPAPAAAGACSTVKLTTSMGPITLALNREKAPISSENFAKYVKSGHYNGTIFHRVMDGFMIQGGGFSRERVQKPTIAPIKNEASNGLRNEPYSVAMARTNVRDSATSQFFINVGNNEVLNYRDETPAGWGYAVFGKVTGGNEVVDRIRKAPVRSSEISEAQPLEPIVLEKAECI